MSEGTLSRIAVCLFLLRTTDTEHQVCAAFSMFRSASYSRILPWTLLLSALVAMFRDPGQNDHSHFALLNEVLHPVVRN